TVLGIFVTGFYLKFIKGTAVFYAAIIAQITIIALFKYTNLGFLWYNVIACGMVMGLSILFEKIKKNESS
ncbi:MAG: hypothetical protein WAR77_03115, partial [Saprospiraceae bacterium]